MINQCYLLKRGVKRMKKNNLWHIVWIVSIYATLITILYLVIVYKVKWETKDYTKYLYFYDCGSNDVCTTDTKIDVYYSRVECPKDICPRIISTTDDLAIIGTDEDNYLFDYTKSKIVNDTYKSYKFSSQEDYYVVRNQDNMYGVIDDNGNIQVELKYNEIIDYVDTLFIYREGENIVIAPSDPKSELQPLTLDSNKYSDVSLFTKEKFVFREDNAYYVGSTADGSKLNEDAYDYIYPYRDILLVFKDSKFDIIDINLNTRLSSKIDTFYPYKKEKERSSLRIKTIDYLLRFNIYDGDNEQSISYIFDLKNNRLYD